MKTLLAIVALSSTLTTASTAFADIDRDTDLIVGEPIWGNCDLQITSNEPYSHMYAPCRLQRHKRDQNGHLQVFVLGEHDLTNFKIGNGWPRSSTFAKVWPLLSPAIPIADWTYCARFGEEQLGIIPLGMIFGHYQNSSQNLLISGRQSCVTAAPEVKAYFQTQCAGAFVWVYSVESLVFGLHLSYRKMINPALCWTVAVAPGN